VTWKMCGRKLVGDIQDEFDSEKGRVSQNSANEFSVRRSAWLSEFNDFAKISDWTSLTS